MMCVVAVAHPPAPGVPQESIVTHVAAVHLHGQPAGAHRPRSASTCACPLADAHYSGRATACLEADVVDVAVRKVVAGGGDANVDLAGQVGQRRIAGALAGDGIVERCREGREGRWVEGLLQVEGQVAQSAWSWGQRMHQQLRAPAATATQRAPWHSGRVSISS